MIFGRTPVQVNDWWGIVQIPSRTACNVVVFFSSYSSSPMLSFCIQIYSCTYFICAFIFGKTKQRLKGTDTVKSNAFQ